MDWISIDDACPAEGDVVLVSDQHGAYFVATYFRGRWETVEMKSIEVRYWTEISPVPISPDSLDEFESDAPLPSMKLVG